MQCHHCSTTFTVPVDADVASHHTEEAQSPKQVPVLRFMSHAKTLVSHHTRSCFHPDSSCRRHDKVSGRQSNVVLIVDAVTLGSGPFDATPREVKAALKPLAATVGSMSFTIPSIASCFCSCTPEFTVIGVRINW